MSYIEYYIVGGINKFRSYKFEDAFDQHNLSKYMGIPSIVVDSDTEKIIREYRGDEVREATTDFGECDPECAWLVGSTDDGIEFSACAMAKASSVPRHIRNRVIQNGN